MLKKLLLPIFALSAKADVPTNCAYSDSVGVWEFKLGFYSSNNDPAQNGPTALTSLCGYDNLGPVQETVQIQLSEKSKAVNLQTGSVGHYTTIYNQGFEIYLDGQKWFVYYFFDSEGYSCQKTSVGYLHDDTGKNWWCIQADKISGVENSHNWMDASATETAMKNLRHDAFVEDTNFISGLNAIPNLPWTAEFNPEDKKYTGLLR